MSGVRNRTDYESLRKLKADLHIHTAEDPRDRCSYTTEALIELAAGQGFDVLGITNHSKVVCGERMRAVAAEKGVLLISGIEVSVGGKHVVILNADGSAEDIHTFNDIAAYKNPERLVLAPHPFFPSRNSLNAELVGNIELFDAIEYNHFYFTWLNFNKKAVRLAAENNLPLIGASDAHYIEDFGDTYSLITADRSVGAVLDAIRKGKVEVVTAPLKVNWRNVRRGLVKVLFSNIG